MFNFAGNFARSAFRMTAFSSVPKYSTSFLTKAAHASSLQWMNMQKIKNLDVQNLRELIEKCKQQNSSQVDLGINLFNLVKDLGLSSAMQKILCVARGLMRNPLLVNCV